MEAGRLIGKLITKKGKRVLEYVGYHAGTWKSKNGKSLKKDL